MGNMRCVGRGFGFIRRGLLGLRKAARGVNQRDMAETCCWLIIRTRRVSRFLDVFRFNEEQVFSCPRREKLSDIPYPKIQGDTGVGAECLALKSQTGFWSRALPD